MNKLERGLKPTEDWVFDVCGRLIPEDANVADSNENVKRAIFLDD